MQFLKRPIENFAPHIWLITLPAHALALFAAYLALRPGLVPPIWGVATFLGWVLISGFGVAIGFHRLLSHNSFRASARMRAALAYLGCLGGQGSPIFWAALHRGIHHPYSDTEKDIHSPVRGWWISYFGWQVSFRPEYLPLRAALDLQRDRSLMLLHRRYYYVVWGTALALALIDFRLALFGLIVPMVIAIHTENLVNLCCHLSFLGYRNFALTDHSRNVWWLGYFGFGQGWHNNHHAHPEWWNYGGVRWFEWDPCSVLVPLVALAERKKTRTAEIHQSPQPLP